MKTRSIKTSSHFFGRLRRGKMGPEIFATILAAGSCAAIPYLSSTVSFDISRYNGDEHDDDHRYYYGISLPNCARSLARSIRVSCAPIWSSVVL